MKNLVLMKIAEIKQHAEMKYDRHQSQLQMVVYEKQRSEILNILQSIETKIEQIRQRKDECEIDPETDPSSRLYRLQEKFELFQFKLKQLDQDTERLTEFQDLLFKKLEQIECPELIQPPDGFAEPEPFELPAIDDADKLTVHPMQQAIIDEKREKRIALETQYLREQKEKEWEENEKKRLEGIAKREAKKL